MVDGNAGRPVRIDLKQSGYLVDSDGGRVEVVVRDLSGNGCRLETDGSLIEGEAITLTVGKSAPVDGIVRWAVLDEAGVQFV